MENFVVSARKYRPATFASVVGQGHITSTLKNAITRSQLAHAYLFCGPRGVGKTTCARIFAKAINCLDPVDSEACGECESCRSFNEGRSFNIHELDAASNNSVDDIRNLTDQVRIPPQIGRYSVYIIDEVHMLSAAAFNAFLKTLEEPPAHAIFILATTEKHKIIPTILSRCQIFDFNRIRVEDGVKYLRYIAAQEDITCDDESLHLMAQKADGGMRDALSMFDKAVAFCGSDLKLKDVAHTLNILDYDTYFSLVDQLAAGDYRAALVSLDVVLGKGFSGQFFVAGLAGHFRDLLMCKNPQTVPLMDVSGTLLERYKRQAEGWPPEVLFDATALLASLDGALRTSSNQRLTIELGLMKLAGLGQKKNEPVEAGAAEGAKAGADGVVAGEGGAVAGVAGATGGSLPRMDDYPLPDIAAKPEVSTEPAFVTSPVAEGAAAVVAETAGEGAVDAGAENGTASACEPSEPTPSRAPSSELEWPRREGGRPQANIESSPTGARSSAEGWRESAEGGNLAQAVRPESEARSPQSAPPATTAPTTSPTPTTLSTPAGDPHPPKKGFSLSGRSLASILDSGISAAAPTDEVKQAAETSVDLDSETKIAAAREKFLSGLATRPRIAMAFKSMKIAGNRVDVEVPNESLHDEIMRNRTEILAALAEAAEVEGALELQVEVKTDRSARMPIKVEDKLQYLNQKNPLLDTLRKELELEIE